jgi:hypothetical protein
MELSLSSKMNGQNDDKSTVCLPKGFSFDDYQPPNWDEFFMLKVYLTGKTIVVDYNQMNTSAYLTIQQRSRKIREQKLVLYSYVTDVISYQVTMAYQKVNKSVDKNVKVHG